MKCCPNKKITIAIDGFSSCGKSTFAKEIAARLGYVFIDTGAMYRAVTLFALQEGLIGPESELNEKELCKRLPEVDVAFVFNPKRGASDVILNGENIEQQIRTIAVSDAVSRISQLRAVREKLVALQQQMGQNKGIVMDGRDIGTVVFPDAELKLFMTADPAVRAERRFLELRQKGDAVSLEEIERNIRDRDLADQTRQISPLMQAADAVVLDNSQMSVAQQMEWVMARLEALECVENNVVEP